MSPSLSFYFLLSTNNTFTLAFTTLSPSLFIFGQVESKVIKFMTHVRLESRSCDTTPLV